MTVGLGSCATGILNRDMRSGSPMLTGSSTSDGGMNGGLHPGLIVLLHHQMLYRLFLTRTCMMPAVAGGTLSRLIWYVLQHGESQCALLDYTAGVLPVTHVDKSQDQLPKDFLLQEAQRCRAGCLYTAYTMQPPCTHCL